MLPDCFGCPKTTCLFLDVFVLHLQKSRAEQGVRRFKSVMLTRKKCDSLILIA